MLNYRLYGEQHDTFPIIMLHGLFGSLDNWNTQAKRLASDYKVITVDLRNHGQSPHQEGMSYRLMSQDVLQLLDHLTISRCLLLGHSMGGKVAMQLASESADRVEKLIVVDIAPKSYPPRHNQILRGMLSLPLAEIADRKSADNHLAGWIANQMDRAFILKNLRRNSSGFYWQCYLAEIAKSYLTLSGFPSKNAPYQGNTCFIRGGQSDYISDQDWTNIRQSFNDPRLITLKKSGHLPHIEEAENFERAVRDFIVS